MTKTYEYTPSLHTRMMLKLEGAAPNLARLYISIRTPLRRRARQRKLQRGYRHIAHVVIAHKRAKQA